MPALFWGAGILHSRFVQDAFCGGLFNGLFAHISPPFNLLPMSPNDCYPSRRSNDGREAATTARPMQEGLLHSLTVGARKNDFVFCSPDFQSG